MENEHQSSDIPHDAHDDLHAHGPAISRRTLLILGGTALAAAAIPGTPFLQEPAGSGTVAAEIGRHALFFLLISDFFGLRKHASWKMNIKARTSRMTRMMTFMRTGLPFPAAHCSFLAARRSPQRPFPARSFCRSPQAPALWLPRSAGTPSSSF